MKKNNLQKGFTIVETLVAISILTLAIVGTFTAVQSGLSTSSYARDQITAFYLIQDVVEYTRNVRDQNALVNLGGGSVDWLNGFSNCFKPNICTIDTISGTVTSVPTSPSTKMLLDANGRFNYSSGTLTRFSRDITIEKIGTGDEARITVTINWTAGGVVSGGHVSISTELFNTR